MKKYYKNIKDLSLIECEQHLNDIKQLYKDVLTKHPNSLAISIEEVDKIITIDFLKSYVENGKVSCYFIDSKLVGLLVCKWGIYRSHRHILDNVTLLTNRTGIGAILVYYVIDYFKDTNRDSDYKVFKITPFENNVKFYQKFGFKTVCKLYKVYNKDLYLMQINDSN